MLRAMMKAVGAVVMAVGASLLWAGDARAVVVLAEFDGENDCSGFFGTGFDSCTIFISDDGDRIELSPVIIKFDEVLDVEEANDTVYPTIDGMEFSFSGLGTDNATGTWSYTGAADDPGIKYWAAKAGGGPAGGFILFWDVNASFTQTGGPCTATSGSANYNLACLQAANIVTSGTWFTPADKDGDPRELSHLTIYDTKPPKVVPEPVTLLLIGSGLVGLGFAIRRRSTV